MPVTVLGISGMFGHDASACIMHGDVLLAYAEEERLLRVKRARGAIPENAARYCIQAAGLSPSAIDMIAIACDPAISEKQSQRLDEFESRFLRLSLWNDCCPHVVHVPHHSAHAASALYSSGFADAAFLVMDGHGERTSCSGGIFVEGRPSTLFEVPISSSLGHFYSAVSQHVGFGSEDVGKLMGLAAYGTPQRDFKPFDLEGSGVESVIAKQVHSVDHVYAYRETQAAWDAWLCERIGPVVDLKGVTDAGPNDLRQRAPKPVLDLAASAQAALEEAVCFLAALTKRLTAKDALVVSGGVALNCSANGVLIRKQLFDTHYFMPAAHDAGAAVGAAAIASGYEPKSRRPLSPYLGSPATLQEIYQLLQEWKIPYQENDDPIAEIGEDLLKGRIVGWFSGRAEMGPRALGSRSILALPSNGSVRDTVNRIKGRELWRPLSPAILATAMPEYFTAIRNSPYMLVADKVRDSMRSNIPAVVHVDGTARPQSVDSSSDAAFVRLLQYIGNRTGVPVVLNTSFNDASEPIVHTIRDAVRTFFGTGLDTLFLDNVIIRKPSNE